MKKLTKQYRLIKGRFMTMAGIILVFAAIFLFNIPAGYAAHTDPAVIAYIPLTGSPISVAVNPATNRIYITHANGKSVTVADGNTYSIVSTLSFTTETTGVAVNPITNLIYVSHRLTASVTVIDGNNNSIVTTIPVGNGPANIGVNPVTNHIYVPNSWEDTVSVIDGNTNSVIALPVGYWPVDVGVNPVTNRFYVAHFYGQAVWAMDGSSTQLLDTIPLSFNASGLALNADTNHIYVAGSGTDIPVIDGSDNSITTTIPLGASGIGVNPETNRIYVSHYANNTVTVVDGATNLIESVVPMSAGPISIAVNPDIDRVYVGSRLAPTLVSVMGNRDELHGEVQWADQFGTPSFDAATSVAADNGFVYVGGHTTSILPGQVSAGGADAFLRKYDSTGNEIWTRQFGSAANERVGGVFADSSGIYVTGDTLGVLPGQISSGGRDVFIRLYDFAGNEVWTQQFGSDNADWPNDITILDTAIYVVGRTWGQLPGQTNLGASDAFISKLDLNGNLIWSRHLGTGGNDEGFGVAANQTGVYIAGNMQIPGESAFLSKYDTDGNEIWTNHFGAANGASAIGDFAIGVATDASGIYVAGGFYDMDSLPYTFVHKYDFAGNEVWTREFATLNTWATAVSMNNGLLHVAGTVRSYLPGQLPLGQNDVFVQAYDPDGSEIWTNQVGTAGSEDGYDISANGDGIYVVGRTNGVFPGDQNEGDWDGYVIKLAADNQSPTAKAGGPYTVDEGGSITLHGTGSTDPDPGDTLTFEWDLDYDGSNFDVDTTDSMPLFDATNLDGPITLTVALRVTDSAGAMSDIDTASVTINNVAPTIEQVTAPLDPVDINNQPVHFTVAFSDPSGLDTHTLQIGWGDNMADQFSPVTSPTSHSHTYPEAGVYTVSVILTDDDGGTVEANYNFIVIYDPDGGFVTGGGWIWSDPGSCQLDAICADAEGKANFGFVSKYKKGASIPTGNTEFNFSAGGLNFHSDAYEWLVINQGGTNAQYKGSGTINGSPAATGEPFKFMIWAKDGNPSGDDTFRIKIWYEDGGDEVIVYDNGPDREIGGGNIKVHTGK
jgi:YVTN family beta-propeller protein